MKIVCKYAATRIQYMIGHAIDIHRYTISKVPNKLIDRMPVTDLNHDQLGGVRTGVQIDDTILNYKCKPHCGRSPTKRTEQMLST